jgi:uncharacterized protein YigA (DUF484 family)
MTDTVTDDILKPEQVATYLRRHPDFLGGYPELATKLTLPREQGSTASLTVYQMQALRDKNADLESRLAELIAIAAENEQLMKRVHELTVALLRANTTAVTARSVITKLSTDFHTEHVRLLLFGEASMPPADWLVQEPQGRAALPEFADFLAHHEPISGRLSPERLQWLFGPHAGEVRSAAVMPLGELGLLAIGSSDPDHFQPGMGTLFLKMIATTITAALMRARDLG